MNVNYALNRSRHCPGYWSAILLPMLLYLCAPVVFAESRGIGIQPVKKQASKLVKTGTYRALIIGNNDYRKTGGKWPPLKTAISDAAALQQVLTEQYNFTDVKLLENATRRDVLIALQNLSKQVLSNDNVLVYYAGHGYLDDEANRGYWVPVDARGLDHTTYLRNSTIRDELTHIASRAKHTLLISDSCFSGTLLRSGSRGIAADVNSDLYYQKVASKKSVQIMSAGGVEYVDDDYKSSGHSPFTYFLLNELRTNNRPLLALNELSTNVEKAVANNVEQVPASGVLHGAGDELGEFIFIKVNVTVKGVSKDKVKVVVDVKADENAPAGKPSVETTVTQQKSKKRQLMPPLPTL